MSEERETYAVLDAPQARLARFRAMSESELQSAIIAEIEAAGGVWAHVRDSRGQTVTGLPDLVFAVPLGRDRSVVGLVEVKSQTGQIRLSQRPWLDLITRFHTETFFGVVRPVRTASAWGYDDVLLALGVSAAAGQIAMEATGQ